MQWGNGHMLERTGLYKKIKAINWKKGAGSSIYYAAMLVAISTAVVLFTEYYHGYTKIGSTQIYADLLADGACYIGNNGWGIDKSQAKSAYRNLVEYNESSFEDVSVPASPSFKYVDTSGREGSFKRNKEDNGKDASNTVVVKTKSNARTLTTNQVIGKSSSDRTKTAVTQIAYSGGMQIVMEAYRHTYEYAKMNRGKNMQTPYSWGGGHGQHAGWESGADCSGFVDGVYWNCGYDIGTGTTSQLENTGTEVSGATSPAGIVKNAMPGDIILLWYGGTAPGASGHVVIYAGSLNGVPYVVECKGGRDVHQFGLGGFADARRGGHIDRLNTSCSRYMTRRIVKTNAKAYKLKKAGNISGLSEQESNLYRLLSDPALGLTHQEIICMMGVWGWESGCDPLAIQSVFSQTAREQYAANIRSGKYSIEKFASEDGASGYGLAQWTTAEPNWAADRKAQLWNFAKSMHSNVTSLEVQVAFFMKEMAGRNEPGFRAAASRGIRSGVSWFVANYENVPGDRVAERTAIATRIAGCVGR